MAGNLIPTVTHTYNAYNGGNKLIGLTEEMEIPNFAAITETISGSGILGEIQEAVLGHFASQELKVAFHNLDTDIAEFMDPTKVIDLNLRAAQQQLNRSDASVPFRGIRIGIRGKAKSFEPGVLKQGGRMGSAVILELLRVIIEIDGIALVELDKLNQVYVVGGRDIMEEMRKYC